MDIKPPHRATINRILDRHHLLQPRSKTGQSTNLPEDYPKPDSQQANAIHQFDFVSRRIKGSGERFYGCHLLDLARRWPYLRTITTQSAQAVIDFLVSAWQETGLPTALQIDNDIVWNGGGRGQRVLSTVTRFCLAVGVQVIYIPPYTPKANGIIESFNDLRNSNFWRRINFTDLTHLEAELPLFETYCRQRRPLPEFGGQTAANFTLTLHLYRSSIRSLLITKNGFLSMRVWFISFGSFLLMVLFRSSMKPSPSTKSCGLARPFGLDR